MKKENLETRIKKQKVFALIEPTKEIPITNLNVSAKYNDNGKEKIVLMKPLSIFNIRKECEKIKKIFSNYNFDLIIKEIKINL